MIEVTLCSFLISLFCEMVRLKSMHKALESVQIFFDGMANWIYNRRYSSGSGAHLC